MAPRHSLISEEVINHLSLPLHKLEADELQDSPTQALLLHRGRYC
jgi:hypothetical protein